MTHVERSILFSTTAIAWFALSHAIHGVPHVAALVISIVYIISSVAELLIAKAG